MELGELLDDLTKSYVVGSTDDGDRLVAMKLADDWGIGMACTELKPALTARGAKAGHLAVA